MLATKDNSQKKKLPKWRFIEKFDDLSEDMIKQILKILLNEAGVKYTKKSLGRLPLSFDSPTMVLENQNKIEGVFASTRLNSKTTRILVFAIDSKFQRRGYGSICWDSYIAVVKKRGYQNIQLEVKSSNINAINFYFDKGMEITGKISKYYENEIGFLMEGEC